MIDLETIMAQIEEVYKIWLPIYLYRLSIEKGDSLIGVDNSGISDDILVKIQAIMGPNFDLYKQGVVSYNEAAYATWNLPYISPYPLTFVQYVAGDPTILNTSNGSDVALRHSICVSAIIRETGIVEAPKIAARVSRVLVDILKNHLADMYQSVSLLKYNSGVLKDSEEQDYQLTEVHFAIDII